VENTCRRFPAAKAVKRNGLENIILMGLFGVLFRQNDNLLVLYANYGCDLFLPKKLLTKQLLPAIMWCFSYSSRKKSDVMLFNCSY